jgi:hypothetical protein
MALKWRQNLEASALSSTASGQPQPSNRRQANQASIRPSNTQKATERPSPSNHTPSLTRSHRWLAASDFPLSPHCLSVEEQVRSSGLPYSRTCSQGGGSGTGAERGTGMLSQPRFPPILPSCNTSLHSTARGAVTSDSRLLHAPAALLGEARSSPRSPRVLRPRVPTPRATSAASAWPFSLLAAAADAGTHRRRAAQASPATVAPRGAPS